MVDINQYIYIHDIDDSWGKDICTGLDIPEAATGEHDNVQLCDQTSLNFYRGEHPDFASSLIAASDSDAKKAPILGENNSNGRKLMSYQD